MRTVHLVTLAIISTFTACAADEPTLSDASQGIASGSGASFGGLVSNGIMPNGITMNAIAVNRIIGNRIIGNHWSMNLSGAHDLLATPEAREVLGFVIGCAIPKEYILVADFKGHRYEFPGELGLAPEWLERPLDKRGKGWVSACMFARVNAVGASVLISLRGPNRALVPTAEERANWTFQEGAFYGNMFVPPNTPIRWIACSGEDQGTDGTGGTGVTGRDCATPDPAHPGLTLCGFKYAGPCGDFARHHACESFSEKGTFYRDCHSKPSVDGHDDDDRDHDDGREFQEVITTYLMP